ncbi:MAG TPA: DHA2 family efflux MFS transporter permease subunit [Streptosporangiaceae bacterium]|nr:DHA2 family efflux MFS transporter permease subunit [Streptosporangiaceae bacterium]
MPELSRGRRLLVLLICCSSLFIVGLDSTIVNVALPAIGRELHGGVSGLQWTIDGYTLVLASLLMLGGATADRIGRRRVFLAGLATFTAGSGLCSLAPGLGWLVAFRMVQAVGGSMLNPVAMSIITNTFPDRSERARALGAWGGAYAMSMALGPVIGGVLVDTVGWRGAFWVNIPVGIAAIALTLRFVPESRAPRPRRPDPAGQALIVMTLAALTYGIIEGPSHGWSSPLIVGLFVVSAVTFGALLVWELRRDEPVVDPRFFRSPPFTGAVLTAISAHVALAGFLFLASLYLQDVLRLSALAAGLHLLPMAAVMGAGAVLSGRIVGRSGARLPMMASGIALCASGLLLSRLTQGSGLLSVLLAFCVFGVGSGLVGVPITQAAVSGMPATQAGVASGIASTSRQVGQSLGVAVFGSILAVGTRGHPGPAGFIAASREAWLLLASCGVVVALLGFVTTGERARRGAARTAEILRPAARRALAEQAEPGRDAGVLDLDLDGDVIRGTQRVAGVSDHRVEDERRGDDAER